MFTEKIRVDQYFCLLFCFILIVLSGSLATREWKEQNANLVRLSLLQPQKLVKLEDANYQATQAASLNQVSAEAYYVVDLDSHSVLLSKDSDKPLYPASTTKLMTALIAREQYQTHQVITAGEEVNAAGHVVGIQPGECLSVKSLLASILINSGNDAAMVLAAHHPLGYSGFIQEMNKKAQALGLTQTYFKNPIGFDHDAQKISARDLAILGGEVYKDSLLADLTNTQAMQITDLTGKHIHELINTNILLEKQSVHGLKTGTTDLAGQVLVTIWDYQDKPILIVVMNSEDRYKDTKIIIEELQERLQLSDFDLLIKS